MASLLHTIIWYTFLYTFALFCLVILTPTFHASGQHSRADIPRNISQLTTCRNISPPFPVVPSTSPAPLKCPAISVGILFQKMNRNKVVPNRHTIHKYRTAVPNFVFISSRPSSFLYTTSRKDNLTLSYKAVSWNVFSSIINPVNRKTTGASCNTDFSAQLTVLPHIRGSTSGIPFKSRPSSLKTQFRQPHTGCLSPDRLSSENFEPSLLHRKSL